MNARLKDAASEAGRVEIRDWSLWTKHVRGAPSLVTMLEGLAEDAVIDLVVDGHPGEWVKKKSGAKGAPTPALKPVGKMRDIWFDWFKTRRGELVSITLASAACGASAQLAGGKPAVQSLDAASQAERDAAWAAFEALGQAGWRRDGPREPGRDALHERGSV